MPPHPPERIGPGRRILAVAPVALVGLFLAGMPWFSYDPGAGGAALAWIVAFTVLKLLFFGFLGGVLWVSLGRVGAAPPGEGPGRDGAE
ncbi:hypothetical protein J0910_19895 [Nocardiopsis sp. CNT-189]|uniref:hypothetical protein n=1 Tax=Nocardiopsis oceanisediminis TaxID=2816862 RepID=UPI003B34595D